VREFWIIRQIATGDFLPELSGVRAGYTHTEPQGHGVPRLFLDAAAARRALTWWLKGATSVDRHRDWEGGKAEDMEVIPVLLKL